MDPLLLAEQVERTLAQTYETFPYARVPSPWLEEWMQWRAWRQYKLDNDFWQWQTTCAYNEMNTTFDYTDRGVIEFDGDTILCLMEPGHDGECGFGRDTVVHPTGYLYFTNQDRGMTRWQAEFVVLRTDSPHMGRRARIVTDRIDQVVEEFRGNQTKSR